MNDPPGAQNCHFIDIEQDEVGINGVTINPNKEFDAEAEWKYLEGALLEKTNPEITERVRAAHKKLPNLFQHINSNSKLTYLFKYDCIYGDFMYPELERQLRKNIACENGKARATGFAIPVLGRLPQIYVDTYLIKCRL